MLFLSSIVQGIASASLAAATLFGFSHPYPGPGNNGGPGPQDGQSHIAFPSSATTTPDGRPWPPRNPNDMQLASGTPPFQADGGQMGSGTPPFVRGEGGILIASSTRRIHWGMASTSHGWHPRRMGTSTGELEGDGHMGSGTPPTWGTTTPDGQPPLPPQLVNDGASPGDATQPPPQHPWWQFWGS